MQFRGHSPRTIWAGAPTLSFIRGREGVEARPYGVWVGFSGKPTLSVDRRRESRTQNGPKCLYGISGPAFSPSVIKNKNQIEAQRQRVRFGEEEQGSGRMTSFLP